MNKAVEKLKEEFLAVLPPTIFFFVALHIIGLVRALMTKGSGLPVISSAQILVGALLIGKAVVLADHWPPINRFPEKPLIYNVLWKTVIYYVVASVIHYLERLYEFAAGTRHIEDHNPLSRQRGKQTVVFGGREIAPDQIELCLFIKRAVANQKNKHDAVSINFRAQRR